MDNCISTAIIMRINEYGESDLLVSFFTPDRGRLEGIAKGARRSFKRFVNCLDAPFTEGRPKKGPENSGPSNRQRLKTPKENHVRYE